MIEVLETQEYSDWLRGLRDSHARQKAVKRLERPGEGNPGDVRPIGEGVSEMRINCGPGYRIYYVDRGSYALALIGGDTSTQDRDIAEAERLAEEYQE